MTGCDQRKHGTDKTTEAIKSIVVELRFFSLVCLVYFVVRKISVFSRDNLHLEKHERHEKTLQRQWREYEYK